LEQDEGLRPERCAWCAGIFYLCRRHDSRQIYCDEQCRSLGYRLARRRANASHQASEEGRADHRDRQREYRRRRRERVTDKGAKKLSVDGTVCVADAPAAPTDGVPASAACESAHVSADHCLDPPVVDVDSRARHRWQGRGAQGASAAALADASVGGQDDARGDRALFYQSRIRVVLSADSEAISFGLGLTDGLGFGIDTFYYEVEVLPDAEQRRRAKRLCGLGDFREVRRLVAP
jgi:hypothetical protein